MAFNLFGQSNTSTATNNDNRNLTDNRVNSSGSGHTVTGGGNLTITDAGSTAKALEFAQENARLQHLGSIQSLSKALEFGTQSRSASFGLARDAISQLSGAYSNAQAAAQQQAQQSRGLVERALSAVETSRQPDLASNRMAMIAFVGIGAFALLMMRGN